MKSENFLCICVYIYIHVYIKIFTFHFFVLEKKLADRYSVLYSRRMSVP